MTGWIVAAAVLLLAVIVIWRLRSRLAESRDGAEELRVAWHQAQEEVEQQRSDAMLGRMLAELAPGLAREDAPPEAPPEALIETIVEYRRRIHAYDSAVQYCLQPVELMPGADEDDLDKLLEHVTGARKRLFEARTALVEDDMLQRLPELAGKAVGKRPGTERLAALAMVAGAGRNGHAIELGEVLESVLQLTRARNPDGPVLEAEMEELPVLPPWPWLVPDLVHLLQLGMRGCASHGTAHLGARFADGRVQLQFSGDARDDTDQADSDAFHTALFNARQRLDERGLKLTVGGEDKRLHQFTLDIPLAAGEHEPQ